MAECQNDRNLLRPGVAARLHSLTGAAESYNGTVVKCIEFNKTTGRWSVALETGEQPNVKAENLEIIEQASSTTKLLRPGTVVRLHSLRSAGHLNGTVVKCIEFNKDSGRWSVALETGERQNVKPENLEIIEQPSPSTELLRPGAAARLHSLRGAGRLNGKAVECIEFNIATGRWLVALETGERSNVKPENLEIIEQPASTTKWLRPGTMARLHSLRGAESLNGKPVTCIEFSIATGRWSVALETGEHKHVKPENLEIIEQPSFAGAQVPKLKKDDIVRLHSLQNTPELNGQEAIVGDFDESSGRWTVILASDERKMSKAENLELIYETFRDSTSGLVSLMPVSNDVPQRDCASDVVSLQPVNDDAPSNCDSGEANLTSTNVARSAWGNMLQPISGGPGQEVDLDHVEEATSSTQVGQNDHVSEDSASLTSPHEGPAVQLKTARRKLPRADPNSPVTENSSSLKSFASTESGSTVPSVAAAQILSSPRSPKLPAREHAKASPAARKDGRKPGGRVKAARQATVRRRKPSRSRSATPEMLLQLDMNNAEADTGFSSNSRVQSPRRKVQPKFETDEKLQQVGALSRDRSRRRDRSRSHSSLTSSTPSPGYTCSPVPRTRGKPLKTMLAEPSRPEPQRDPIPFPLLLPDSEHWIQCDGCGKWLEVHPQVIETYGKAQNCPFFCSCLFLPVCSGEDPNVSVMQYMRDSVNQAKRARSYRNRYG